MPTLIDGHNLIGQMPSISLADPEDEAKLVMLLRRYAARQAGRKVVVVFDGGVYGHPDNLNGYGVECHFARSPSDADRELIRRIKAIKRPGEWQVVTSDRAVAGEARACGVRVVSAGEFGRRLVQSPQTRAGIREKSGDKPLSPQEIAEWLRLFGEEEE